MIRPTMDDHYDVHRIDGNDAENAKLSIDGQKGGVRPKRSKKRLGKRVGSNFLSYLLLIVILISVYSGWSVVLLQGGSTNSLFDDDIVQDEVSQQASSTTPTDSTDGRSKILKHHPTSNVSNDESKTAWLHTPRQRDPTKPRLEFLHIQKNAGTYFEVLALKHGLPWGACHFEFYWKRRKKNILKDCPPIRDAPRGGKQRDVYWHYPLQHIPNLIGPSGANHDPYDNNEDPMYAARPKKFFAVVRSPYSRLVSLYIMNSKKRAKSIEKLNEWVRGMLSDINYHKGRLGLKYPNATICQYSHFYDNDGNAMVDHIIHFESLKEDFDLLIEEYDLPSTFSPTKMEKINSALNEKYTYKSFDNETVKMINLVCAKDFDLGRGYPKIEVG